ncbi:MarR family winged helix-turn-helix transcriptional regulator [Pseudonocardia sp. TRM90224]|uniref:MarR family winged helix-turn-helix transcriptional regulator n=1 Tax=Pseudonocardia sp. TRM90224 TaxID=2812678 RepID=UPI001E59F31B|nr:MarR family transcriptional regulator [Pseudonocardia sp. TRM90224]
MSSVPDVAELYGLLAQVVDRFMRQTGEIFAAHQVPYAQARTLLQLGDERTAVHMKTLAESMGVVPRSITSVVDGLERRELVRRTPDPDDRRAMLISLTDRGTELVERIHQANIELGGELFAPLSAQDLATFGELLRAVLKDAPADREGQQGR